MGKHKKKQHQKQAQQRREHKRSQRNARRPERRGDPGRPEIAVRLPPIDPPEPGRCLPPIVLDATGKVVPDPHAELGLSREAEPTEQTIMAAWRARIVEHPPERDPEGARRLLAARDRLLAPERVIERELGTLHVPDPAAFGLPPGSGASLSPCERLVGQLALYALPEASEHEDRAQLALHPI